MQGRRYYYYANHYSSVIHLNYRTSEQKSIKMLLSLVCESQREETFLGFDLKSFYQNWVCLLFAVTLETELCSGSQMGWGSGAQRENSFSQPGFCHKPGSTA